MTAKRPKGKDRPLSARECRLVQGVIAGQPVSKAALAAGYTPATAKASIYNTLHRPPVRNALTAAMEKAGITPELLAEKLREGLEAKKVTRTSYKGRVYATHRDVDQTERRETARLIALLRGDLASETRPADQAVQINFISNLSLEPFKAARAKALAAMAEQEAQEALPEAPEPLNPEDHP
jgi:hypothetical protein